MLKRVEPGNEASAKVHELNQASSIKYCVGLLAADLGTLPVI